jgi:hypothetical protein
VAGGFGVLSVICDRPDGGEVVSDAVVEAYALDGVYPVDARAAWDDAEHWEALDAPVFNPSTVLGEDDLLIGDESMRLVHPRLGDWGTLVSVKSRRWELAPPGRHPLALRLSRRWPVLSLTWTPGVTHELCLYRRGGPVSFAVCGDPPDPPPVATPFDFDWLARLRGFDGARLRSRFCDPVVFRQNAGLPESGFAEIFGPAPLEDYLERYQRHELLALRRRSPPET